MCSYWFRECQKAVTSRTLLQPLEQPRNSPVQRRLDEEAHARRRLQAILQARDTPEAQRLGHARPPLDQREQPRLQPSANQVARRRLVKLGQKRVGQLQAELDAAHTPQQRPLLAPHLTHLG